MSFRIRAGLLAASLSIPLTLHGQYNEDFSHRNHLGYGAKCADCHSTATASTKASDNLLPSLDSCVTCHGPGQVKEPARLLVTKFNHQLHTSLPGLGAVIASAVRSGSYLGKGTEELAVQLAAADQCTACHRGLATSDKVSRAAFPVMADCLVCHGDIEAPFTCEKCHDADANLKPAFHTAQYLEEHSRPGALTETSSCATCHGREFTCLGCH